MLFIGFASGIGTGIVLGMLIGAALSDHRARKLSDAWERHEKAALALTKAKNDPADWWRDN